MADQVVHEPQQSPPEPSFSSSDSTSGALIDELIVDKEITEAQLVKLMQTYLARRKETTAQNKAESDKQRSLRRKMKEVTEEVENMQRATVAEFARYQDTLRSAAQRKEAARHRSSSLETRLSSMPSSSQSAVQKVRLHDGRIGVQLAGQKGVVPPDGTFEL